MQTAGPYRLQQRVSGCEVGDVWSGADDQDRPVTVAVLNERASVDDRWRDAFAAAADALAQAGADPLPIVGSDHDTERPWVACAVERGAGAAQIFVVLGQRMQPAAAQPAPQQPAPAQRAPQASAPQQDRADRADTTAALTGATGAGTVTRPGNVSPWELPPQTEPPTTAFTPVAPSTSESDDSTQVIPAQPVSAPPGSAPPESGQPVSGQPVSGQPAAVQPVPEPGYPGPGQSYPGSFPPAGGGPATAAVPQQPYPGPFVPPVRPAPAQPGPGYPTSGYPPTGYPTSGLASPGYATPGFPATDYPTSGYPGSGEPVSGQPVSGRPAPNPFDYRYSSFPGPGDSAPTSGYPFSPPPVSGSPESFPRSRVFGDQPPAKPKRRGWLIAVVAVVALLIGAGTGVGVMALRDGRKPAISKAPPALTPDQLLLPVIAPAAPGIEPPLNGGWPGDSPTFGATEATKPMKDLAGVGFDFRVPASWSCVLVETATAAAHYKCGIGQGDELSGGDLVVRTCEQVCSEAKRTQFRLHEEAWGLHWTKSGPFATWAENKTVDGKKIYGLVYVSFWRSVAEGPIDRELVLHMTSPEASSDNLKKVVNSIRTSTFTL